MWHINRINLKCPYCDVYAQFVKIDKKEVGSFFIYRCVNCDNEVLVVFDGNYEKIIDQYPKRIPKMDPSIPKNVAEDFIEAIKCFDVGAYKAAAVMCRRALQSSLIERGSTKDRLLDQIDELYEKEVITKALRDWAHEIRIAGNIGAHPDKDGLKDLDEEEAREILDFMEEYLNYVYVMPARVMKKRRKRATKENK